MKLVIDEPHAGPQQVASMASSEATPCVATVAGSSRSMGYAMHSGIAGYGHLRPGLPGTTTRETKKSTLTMQF